MSEHPALDMGGYLRLGVHRRTFDDWLRAEGLIDQSIFYARFGEGYVDAKCYDQPLRPGPNGEPVWHWQRFAVTTPPPGEVIEVLRLEPGGANP